MPGPVVRCTFSPARAWRPAVAARLARTLCVEEHPRGARQHGSAKWPRLCQSPYSLAAIAPRQLSVSAPGIQLTVLRLYCRGPSTQWRSKRSARRLYAPGSVRAPRRARTKYPRRITRRSTGAPTACHQARPAAWTILRSPGLAPYRRRPVSSNVRRLNAAFFCRRR